MRRSYQTQWAGQFGVAHELVRRGYLVTFTTGNARDDDLLCLSQSGDAFSVQVKSLSSKTFFPCQGNLRRNEVLGWLGAIWRNDDEYEEPSWVRF
jgi:hypothetical protein